MVFPMEFLRKYKRNNLKIKQFWEKNDLFSEKKSQKGHFHVF